MHKYSIARLTLAAILLLSSAAKAEVYRLQFNDQIYGGHRTVELKKAMQKQHRVDASKLEIEKVDVVVKSQQGGGQVWVGSRYSQSNRLTAAGQAANFNNPANWTFSRISFPAQGFDSDLQLNLNGQLKLREVIVHARDTPDSESVAKNKQGNARITLPMNHLKLTGQNTINLKKILRSNTKVNPDKYNFKGLEVSVKSRQGGGQVWLESGHQASSIQTVGGIPQAFENNNQDSYDRKYFKAMQGENQPTPWLLKFNGDLKLNEIIINLAPR